MFDEEKEAKLQTFKTALAKVFKKISEGTSPTTVASSYGISPSTISLILQAKKDPQLSTFIKLSRAFNTDCLITMEMLIKELPENFNLTDE